jgi:hypothetical protein
MIDKPLFGFSIPFFMLTFTSKLLIALAEWKNI